MVYWKSLTDWFLAMNLDNLIASILFPLAKWKTVEVETFLLSSQGSRIVNLEKSSIVYLFLVRALNLQILKIEQGSTPRIDRSLWLHSSVLLSQAWSIVHQAFLVSFHITIDYLDRWAPSSSVSRPYNAVTSLYPWFLQPYSRCHDRVSWPCRAPCCIHQIPDWVNRPLQPRIGYKMEPFTQEPPMRKLHFHQSSAVSLFLFFF
jgi:uncharacterized Tic20 family protein